MAANMVEEWIDAYSDEIKIPADSLQSGEQILQNLSLKCEFSKRNAKVLYQGWLQHI